MSTTPPPETGIDPGYQPKPVGGGAPVGPVKAPPESGEITEEDAVPGPERKIAFDRKRDPRARLTIRCSIHHQHMGETPVHIQANGAVMLDGTEQPWTRKTNANGQWQKVDFGWVAGDAGMVVFENPTTNRGESKIQVAIGSDLNHPFCIVRKGAPCSFELFPNTELWVRSDDGESVRYIVHVFPR